MSDYDNHAATRTPKAFTRDVPDKIIAVQTPFVVSQYFLDSDQAVRVESPATATQNNFWDEYTWNVPMVKSIENGEVIIEVVNIATGTATGAATAYFRISTPTFTTLTYDSTRGGTNYVLPIFPAIGVNSTNSVNSPPFMELARVPVKNQSGYFPFTLRLDQYISGTAKMPLRRVLCVLKFIEYDSKK